MTQKEMSELGDAFRDAVLKRTGLTAEDLKCPRERSFMTPCVARDGGVCVIGISYAPGGKEYPSCVGCECDIEKLLAKERSLAK